MSTINDCLLQVKYWEANRQVIRPKPSRQVFKNSLQKLVGLSVGLIFIVVFFVTCCHRNDRKCAKGADSLRL